MRNTSILSQASRRRSVTYGVLETKMLSKIFDRVNGDGWDVVFYFGEEPPHPQDDGRGMPQPSSFALSLGKECADRGVKAFVQVGADNALKTDPWRSQDKPSTGPHLTAAPMKRHKHELAEIEG